MVETIPATLTKIQVESSGAEGDWTPDLLHAMQALSQAELQPQITISL